MDKNKLAKKILMVAKDLLAVDLYDVRLSKLPEGHPKKVINRKPLSLSDAHKLRETYAPNKRRFIEIQKIRIATKTAAAITWKEFLDEVDYFQVEMAEGSPSRLKGKKLRHPKMIEMALEAFERPDAGYDKVFFKIHMNDGQTLSGFRYDHGERDARFRDQLASYIKRLKRT